MTLEDLLDKLWFSAENSTQKGSSFERLIASYLRTAPEFADRFDEVYLWQEWPERGNQHDHGIDIVAKDITTGGWCAVQCKFYEPQHHVGAQRVRTPRGRALPAPGWLRLRASGADYVVIVAWLAILTAAGFAIRPLLPPQSGALSPKATDAVAFLFSVLPV